MAQLDVSELMTDPDFVDPIQIVRRYPTNNNFGQVSFTEETLETVGSVQPANFKTVQKLPESLRVADVSSFWVKAVITASETDKYPSILVFRGKRYQIQTLADWSNFGAGYSEGTCVAEKIS